MTAPTPAAAADGAATGGLSAETLRYVCMPGSPYAGSTLLGYLLNLHSHCASIGAATGLTRRIDVATYLCSCGALFRDCRFWSQVARRTEQLGHPVTVFEKDFWNTHVRISRRRWLNGVLVRSLGSNILNDARDAVVTRWPGVRDSLRGARSSSWALARAVLDTTGKQVFVDTARDHQRPKHLAPAPGLELRVIHLVRDPRGGTASIMRHTGAGVAQAARRWRHYNTEAHRVRRFVPPSGWLLLHYEDLCRRPQATLERVHAFIGVPAEKLPAELQGGEHHMIGNSMRLKGVDEIREDRRWAEVLGPDDLRTIARITGAASHRLGFAWP